MLRSRRISIDAAPSGKSRFQKYHTPTTGTEKPNSWSPSTDTLMCRRGRSWQPILETGAPTVSATSSSLDAILPGCLTSRRSEIRAPLPHLARLFGVYCFGTTGVAVRPVSANRRRPPPRRWLDGQARLGQRIKLLRYRFCPLTRGMRQPFQYALPFLERAGQSRSQSRPRRMVTFCE